ncbi:nitroreductase family protein [Sporomusa acidovorans]|uniref:Nitroreductase domain-containing protein n=1 Tax=Sporomusa acidovorans (strain ATCC 49682 / DSM 3132 / Mol) TaxID=1123286 RepID=A0ABZ3J6E2_SPOA4|nr:nitroreductase family protein [Sporomusa acidovorans]OZC18539.1 FMN reductase [Sporomusa acidovorans DSM 3132]SDE37795.1 Nitroreductase [Sporomusa acidovorans]
MSEKIKVVPYGGPAYEKEDLMKMEPALLRALLRERVHHTIEVPLYPTLVRGQKKPISAFGLQAQMVYDAWKEKGLIDDAPDILWSKEYLALAQKVRDGVKIEWNVPVPEPFTDEEMAVVNKLIYGRRSIRDWVDKPVPDEMIEKILEAGRAAPIGCNLDEVRFVVIKDPEEAKMVWSDIPTPNAVLIVICYDKRIPKVVAQDKFVPHNGGFDAAAAGDHMLLMAHALGLGGVWLSKSIKSDVTEDTGLKFKELYGLPDYIEVALHIAVGWPAVGTIKTQRMPLKEMMLTKGKK